MGRPTGHLPAKMQQRYKPYWSNRRRKQAIQWDQEKEEWFARLVDTYNMDDVTRMFVSAIMMNWARVRQRQDASLTAIQTEASAIADKLETATQQARCAFGDTTDDGLGTVTDTKDAPVTELGTTFRLDQGFMYNIQDELALAPGLALGLDLEAPCSFNLELGLDTLDIFDLDFGLAEIC